MCDNYINVYEVVEMGKFVILIICISNFLRFKMFFIDNDIGYNFCVLNYL